MGTPEAEPTRKLAFQPSCLLAVVFAVLVHLADAVLLLQDFSCHVGKQQREMRPSHVGISLTGKREKYVVWM